MQSMAMDASITQNVTGASSLRVLMVPMLAYGHISPFLELAKKLTARGGIHIYLCSTPINLASISKKITGKYSQCIELVEFHLQESPELPAHFHTTNGLPIHLFPSLAKALGTSKPEIHSIVKALKPDLVIYDSSLTLFSVTPLRSFPSVWFHIVSAAVLSYIHHLSFNSVDEYPFPATNLRDFEQHKFLSSIGDTAPGTSEFHSHPTLVNTCRTIEGKYLDYTASLFNQKTLPVGPLIPTNTPNATDTGLGDKDIELINWLGQKDEYSTVFASFGTMYYLEEEEIKEIAFGLELSNVNFIWALRSPNGEESRIEEILPEGFLERVRDRGRVVQGWVPQAMILGHSSIGGFLSHCGWISLSEGMGSGVPIIAMPMTLEQPINGRVLVENGAAVEIMRDENGRLKREEIAKVIKDVVIGGAGEPIRRKIRELRENIKSSEQENLDEVVTLIAQLTRKKI